MKSAWRQFKIDAQAQTLMGSQLDGISMTDCALPFGWCESVRNFTLIDDFIAFVMQQRLPSHLAKQFPSSDCWFLYYIDDFSIGAPTRSLCAELLQHAIDTFEFLGLQVIVLFVFFVFLTTMFSFAFPVEMAEAGSSMSGNSCSWLRL